ncbi:hypothetical protein J9874_04061 (plasmid) [Duffyella gerundensis]|uniref:hypothetical protein n=1 Tax=Duffyella gerundensis TaxID=1619313 RepID=UPI001CE33D55|nr:hypothetical protein [Duffyella gerundensis]UCB33478.1 hypothetical protein J9874_04061 [Duffyella gerundensis]
MNNVISDLQHLALLEGDLLIARANVRLSTGTERSSPAELTDVEESIFSVIHRLHYGLAAGRYADTRCTALVEAVVNLGITTEPAFYEFAAESAKFDFRADQYGEYDHF